MKKFNIKIGVLALTLSFGALLSCDTENEDITLDSSESTETELLAKRGEETNCTRGKSNFETREVDIKDPVNSGKMDDRTCHQDYYELTKFNKTYGNYRIADNSNHWDTNGLQPRMERSYPRANNNNGSNFIFKGTFIIERVGINPTNSNRSGTYIAQTKGKYSAKGTSPGSGSKDPAICLYLAKKNADGDFDIYAERIVGQRTRDIGREIIKLTTVKKGTENTLEVRMGFRLRNGVKQHYCNTTINGTPYYWNVPEADRGSESGFRYGAYRCTGGSAHIRWANTDYKRTNK